MVFGNISTLKIFTFNNLFIGLGVEFSPHFYFKLKILWTHNKYTGGRVSSLHLLWRLKDTGWWVSGLHILWRPKHIGWQVNGLHLLWRPKDTCFWVSCLQMKINI